MVKDIESKAVDGRLAATSPPEKPGLPGRELARLQEIVAKWDGSGAEDPISRQAVENAYKLIDGIDSRLTLRDSPAADAGFVRSFAELRSRFERILVECGRRSDVRTRDSDALVRPDGPGVAAGEPTTPGAHPLAAVQESDGLSRQLRSMTQLEQALAPLKDRRTEVPDETFSGFARALKTACDAAVRIPGVRPVELLGAISSIASRIIEYLTIDDRLAEIRSMLEEMRDRAKALSDAKKAIAQVVALVDADASLAEDLLPDIGELMNRVRDSEYVLRRGQVAETLNVSGTRVSHLLSSGRLPGVQILDETLYPKRGVEEIEVNRRPPGRPRKS